MTISNAKLTRVPNEGPLVALCIVSSGTSLHLLLRYEIQYLIYHTQRFIWTYMILKLQRIILNGTTNLPRIIMTHLIIQNLHIYVNKY